MSDLLIASSPVEIEAKATNDNLPDATREAALALFHGLTARLGHAARSLDGADPRWPTHRFYFGQSDSQEIAALLDGLRARPDFVEVMGDYAQSNPAEPSGLFVQRTCDGFTGLLVGHENHDGQISSDTFG